MLANFKGRPSHHLPMRILFRDVSLSLASMTSLTPPKLSCLFSSVRPIALFQDTHDYNQTLAATSGEPQWSLDQNSIYCSHPKLPSYIRSPSSGNFWVLALWQTWILFLCHKSVHLFKLITTFCPSFFSFVRFNPIIEPSPPLLSISLLSIIFQSPFHLPALLIH